jgi:hypothetical protein
MLAFRFRSELVVFVSYTYIYSATSRTRPCRYKLAGNNADAALWEDINSALSALSSIK